MSNDKKTLHKHLNYLQYALGSLTVYKARTIAVVFSLTASIFLLGSIVFLSDGLYREASTAAAYAPDITIQGMMAGRVSPLALSYQSWLLQFPGVDRVVPRLWGYSLYRSSIYTVMGFDPQDMQASGLPYIQLVNGRFPEPGELGSAVIGEYFATSQSLSVGDIFGIRGMGASMNQPEAEFKVVGVFSSSIDLFTSDMILLNKFDAQRILLTTSAPAATDLCVYLTDPAQAPSVAFMIGNAYPELRVITRASIISATEATYGLRGGFASIVWVMLLATVVLIAWNQASTAGQESRREVGILKTLGFGTMDILEIRLIEAVSLGFISASIGSFLAVVYDKYLGAPLLKDFFLGWSSTFPAYNLPLDISVSRLLMLYAIAVFPLLLGSLVPAWLSAITEPDAVLRGN